MAGFPGEENITLGGVVGGNLSRRINQRGRRGISLANIEGVSVLQSLLATTKKRCTAMNYSASMAFSVRDLFCLGARLCQYVKSSS